MRCPSYTHGVLVAVLLVAAGCPTIEIDPKGLEGQAGGAANPGHAGKSGGRAGKGGSAAAGSGVDPEEGYAGSPAPADQDEVGGAGGAGGAGGSGGSAAGSGGRASHAAGSGGSPSPAAGSGGGPIPIGSVTSSTKLSEIKTDADAQALCVILRPQLREADLRTIQRGSCTLEGITGELRGLGQCKQLSEECIAAAQEEEIHSDCSAEDIPDCTDVTMGEFIACTKASLEASAKLLGTFTCDSDLANFSEPPTPAVCAALYQKCPELDSGDEDI